MSDDLENPREYGPADAKFLYELTPRPSLREIAAKLGVTHNTICRWKKLGWKRVRDEKAILAGIETQKKRVISAGKDAREAALMEARLLRMNADVSELDEVNLLKETARRTLVTVCTTLEWAKANAGTLVQKRPREMGALLLDCSRSIAQAHMGWDRYLEILRGLRGEPAAVTAPIASTMEEENPMRDVMAMLEAQAKGKTVQ